MEEKIVKPIQSPKVVKEVSAQENSSEPTPIVEVEPKPSAESVINSTIPYQADPLFHEVASYFNVEPEDWDGAKTKLGAIVDYIAQDINSGDAGDILLRLREMERQLEPPQWGEKRFNNVYKYIRLAQQKSSIDKAMNAYRKQGWY